ncbi:MAG: NAD(P)/FAD-dependent oxidoreductase [Sandarakinorhabdus sp.]|nr:NAD(P)/FAD-dependent oxidoreductase [Sandarakinorhabdus sp.]
MSDPRLDCLIIGGGPAGLTAAIYLARFHLNVLVVDRGAGRARSIPLTNNHAGYPEGVSGNELLNRMYLQAQRFGAEIRTGEIKALSKSPNGFRALIGPETIVARTALLATGVINNRPSMPTKVHDAAVARNLLRYCPVCDGFEVTDRRVAVIGSGQQGASEALFIRSFTKDVTLIAPDGAHVLSDGDRNKLSEAQVVMIDGPVAGYAISDGEMTVRSSVDPMTFDAVYPALGSIAQSALAAAMGAEVTHSGCIKVDAHQRTSVSGVYAAGDVVLGLDQISHAMGEAGVAATAIRNDLNAIIPIFR